MKQLITYLAHLITVPAFILDIWSVLGENINLILLISVSAASLVFWIISIKNQHLEKEKNEAEIKAAEKEEKYYDMLINNMKKKDG